MNYDNVADQMVSLKIKIATLTGLFRLTIRLKVKEGGRKLVELGILNPDDPISLKFSTTDRDIRLVKSQSKIENRYLEFFATFEIRCDGSEKFFDLERVTNHLTIKPINCPRILSNVGIKLLNVVHIYVKRFVLTPLRLKDARETKTSREM